MAQQVAMETSETVATILSEDNPTSSKGTVSEKITLNNKDTSSKPKEHPSLFLIPTTVSTEPAESAHSSQEHQPASSKKAAVKTEPKAFVKPATPPVRVKRKYTRRTQDGPKAKKGKTSEVVAQEVKQEPEEEKPFVLTNVLSYQDLMLALSVQMNNQLQCGLTDRARFMNETVKNFNQRTQSLLNFKAEPSEEKSAETSKGPSLIRPIPIRPLPTRPFDWSSELSQLPGGQNQDISPHLLPLSQLLLGPSPQSPSSTPPITSLCTDSSGYDTASP